MSMTTDLNERYLINPDAVAGGTAQLTATPAEINTGMDGITATATEINAVADRSAQGSALKVATHTIAVFSTVETDMFTLPAGAIVLDVILNVTDAAAEAETIDIGTAGTSNDPNGFLVAVPVNATGVTSAMNSAVMSTGINETYISAQYTGALMYPGVANIAGGDTATDTGAFVAHPWYVGTADPVSYTFSGTVTSHAATITVVYLDLVT